MNVVGESSNALVPSNGTRLRDGTNMNVVGESSKALVPSNGIRVRDGIIDVLAELLSSKEYSDFTIICEGNRFPVHKAIVCLQFKPLAAALKGGFQEAIRGEIEISDHSPHIVECMISFLYTRDYDDSLKPADATVATPLQNNALVYILAEKYDISPLKQLASEKYATLLKTDNPSSSFIDDFITTITTIHEGTPTSDTLIYPIMISSITRHIKSLIHDARFTDLCLANPEMTFDLITNAKMVLDDEEKRQGRRDRVYGDDSFVRNFMISSAQNATA